MRAIILILILAIVALIIAVATGFLDISQTRGAKAPQISTTGNGVTARGFRCPRSRSIRRRLPTTRQRTRPATLTDRK